MRPRLSVAATDLPFKRLPVFLVLLGAAALALPVVVWATVQHVSERGGAIVFSSERLDGGWELFSVGGGGGRSRQLTAHSPAAFGTPHWLPDGDTIAFGGESGAALFLANARTGHLRATPFLRNRPFSDVAWAPDGKRFVYAAADAHGATNLWLVNVSGTKRERLTTGGADTAPSWSPDGKTIAFDRSGKNEPEIFLIRSDGTQQRRLTIGSTPIWSPDSSTIAFTADFGSLYAIGAEGANRRLLGKADSPAWSPDSHSLAATVVDDTGTSHLAIFPAAGGARRMLGTHCADVGAADVGATWAPAKMILTLALCDPGHPQTGVGLQTVDPATGDRRWLIHGWVGNPAWSSGAKRLAFLAGDGVLEVAHADGSGAHPLLQYPAGGETHPAWSPDGRSIAVETSRPNPLRGAPRLIVSPLKLPAWSPDGSRLVGNKGDGDEDVYIANVKTGALDQIYHDDGIGQLTLSDAAWSPNGRRIIFTSENGLVWYDVARRQTLNNPAGADLPGAHPAWSSDGKHIAFDSEFCNWPTRPSSCTISVAPANGSRNRRIATNAAAPTWSPDNHRIAFERLVDGKNIEIYVMNADGSHQRRLTVNAGPDVDPTWQPSH